MQAVLSGRAALAFLSDGANWHSIHYDDLDQLVPRQPAEFDLLFQGVRDLDCLDDVTVDEVKDRLADAVDSSEGVELVLYLLDARLSDSTRDRAAEEFEELAVDSDIVEQIEQVLFAAPFPDSADFDGALAACERTQSHATESLLAEWRSLQPAVQSVFHAWLALGHERFGSMEARRQAQAVCLRHGLFRELSRAATKPSDLIAVQFAKSRDPILKRELPCIVGLMDDWLLPLRASMTMSPSDETAADEGNVNQLDPKMDGKIKRGTVVVAEQNPMLTDAHGQTEKPFGKRSIRKKYKSDTVVVTKQNPMLVSALGQIEKAFGKSSIMKLTDTTDTLISGISTGALSLDLALGGFGFPRGCVVELFGPESSGKTTLALHAIANAQRQGGIAAFIDAEHALDPAWAKRLGVNLEDLLVSQPSHGEEALQIAEMLIKANAVDCIVIDSVAALIPKAKLDGEIGDTHVGLQARILQARMMSQAMRKLTGVIAKAKTVVIFINQIREKIGVMFGSPETMPGGRALKFYSSCRVDVRRVATLKDGETSIGIRMKAKVVKNKVAPPFREAEFDMLGSRGISFEGDLLDMASADGLVEKSGSLFNYGKMHIGQGHDKARQFLEVHPDVCEKLRRQLLINRGYAHLLYEPIAATACGTAG